MAGVGAIIAAVVGAGASMYSASENRKTSMAASQAAADRDKLNREFEESKLAKSESIQQAEIEERRIKALRYRDRSGTLLTGGSGLEEEPTTQKTLLGQ